MITRTIKQCLVAAALFAGLMSGAQAALVTTTSQGTISYGYDGRGLFGAAGADLSGLSYSLTISGDTSGYTDISVPAYSYLYSYGYGANSVSMTVNNATYSWTNDYAQFFLSNGYSVGNSSYPYDQIQGFAQRNNSNVQEYVYNFGLADAYYPGGGPFVGPVLDLNGSYTSSGGYGYAALYSYDNNTGSNSNWYAAPSTVSWNGGTVPEPGTIALFGLALLAFGVTRRKPAGSAKA